MRTKRLAALTGTTLSALLALTACGTDSSAGDDAAPRSGETAAGATTVAGPVDPCAGVTGCAPVRTVDVDGDGTPDTVGVAHGSGGVTVAAGISGKRYTVDLPQTSGAAYTEPLDIFRGAFAMSRAQGADIALHLMAGQGNAEQFAVVSWNGSELVLLPEPPTANRRGATVENVWYLGSSHGVRDSIACRTPGEIAVVRLTAAMSEGAPVPGGGRREENFYTFSGAAWQPSGSDNVPDTGFSYTWSAHDSAFDCDPLGTAP